MLECSQLSLKRFSWRKRPTQTRAWQPKAAARVEYRPLETKENHLRETLPNTRNLESLRFFELDYVTARNFEEISVCLFKEKVRAHVRCVRAHVRVTPKRRDRPKTRHARKFIAAPFILCGKRTKLCNILGRRVAETKLAAQFHERGLKLGFRAWSHYFSAHIY